MTRIKHKRSGQTLFTSKFASLKDALQQAIKTGADLTGADLTIAHLWGANLRGAKIKDDIIAQLAPVQREEA